MEGFSFITGMLPAGLMIVAPILIAATGGMICEKAGVVNIALEGLMTIGAFTAALVHVLLETRFGFSIPLALFLAAAAGGLVSLIHAFASITLKADQVISGTGINLLANGVTVFICQLVFRMDRTENFRSGIRMGFLGVHPTIFFALIILAAAWFMIYKRPWGLRLRAAGEYPQALDSAGGNVARMRYMAVIISGVLAGFAGACLVLTQNIQFTVNAVSGQGFIALAAVSFGRWIPLGILGASVLFGISSSLAVTIVNVRSLHFLPSEVFSLLPYLITLLTLVVFGGKDHAPRAIGQPYDKGKG